MQVLPLNELKYVADTYKILYIHKYLIKNSSSQTIKQYDFNKIRSAGIQKESMACSEYNKDLPAA